MRDRARVVIIGGGAVGCSIAYHLARAGEGDVMVLEKSGLCHGSTWHAAGLVGQLRGNRSLTCLMQWSVELYGRLAAETGQATDWNPVGSLRIAASPARWNEIKRTAKAARDFGLELHLLSAAEALDLFPLMRGAGVVGAAFIPSDGYIDPSSLTQALAKGARLGGVAIHEGVRVTGITVRDRRATEVMTDHGTIACEILVNAAGIWAREVGALADVAVPAVAVEHQYIVTEKIPGLPSGLPSFRDPDGNFYVKPEVGALAVGGWEADTPTFGENGVPPDFARELLASNFDRFAEIAVPAAGRLPVLDEVGVRTLINGPIPISPDGEPVLGKAPGLENVFLACGFTSGIAACGGAGRAVAEWILAGEPGLDLASLDPRRFGPMNGRELHARAVESYGRYYAISRGNEPR
jgi:sarcosine dehydrogenase